MGRRVIACGGNDRNTAAGSRGRVPGMDPSSPGVCIHRTYVRREVNPLRPRVAGSPPRAFEEVLAEHLDALYRTALRLCRGHEADAEDLLQDAALRAFNRYGQLREPAAA